MYRHYTYRLLIGCPSVTQHHPMISTPIAPWNALLLPRRKLAWRRPRRGWRLAISGPVPQFPVESTSLKFNMASPKNHPLAKGDSCYFLLETHHFQVPAEKLQGVLLPVELELFQFGIQKKMSLRKGVTLHRTFGRLQLFFHAVFVFTTLVDPHWSTWIRWKNHGWIFESVKKLGGVPFSRSLCSMGQFPCDAAEIKDLNGFSNDQPVPSSSCSELDEVGWDPICRIESLHEPRWELHGGRCVKLNI